MVAGSTVSGLSPNRPRRMARSVAWPMPVRASEPKSSVWRRAVRGRVPLASSDRAKRSAARIGPTVCEEDGPMPILKSSKRLVFTRLIVGVRRGTFGKLGRCRGGLLQRLGKCGRARPAARVAEIGRGRPG